jgi:hypothetical protein
MGEAIWLVLSLITYEQLYAAIFYIVPPAYGDVAQRKALMQHAVHA